MEIRLLESLIGGVEETHFLIEWLCQRHSEAVTDELVVAERTIRVIRSADVLSNLFITFLLKLNT